MWEWNYLSIPILQHSPPGIFRSQHEKGWISLQTVWSNFIKVQFGQLHIIYIPWNMYIILFSFILPWFYCLSWWIYLLFAYILLNTLRPRKNGRLFADDTFKRIFLNENVGISIKISRKFIHKGPINNIPALVQIMAWRRPGDKPLSEPMAVRLPTHICVTRPQWVNSCFTDTEPIIWLLRN